MIASAEVRSSIAAALRRRATLHCAETVPEIAAAVHRERADAVLVELTARTACEVEALVRQLRLTVPAVPIVACCTVAPGAGAQVRAAIQGGAAALALRGVDDLAAMLDRVCEEAAVHRTAHLVREAVGPALGRTGLLVRDHCVRHASSELDVTALAEALQMPRRTLLHRLRQDGAPNPAALICWGRLFVAAHLVGDAGLSADQAAFALNFASASALRGMLRRYTGLTLGELRARGGLPHLVDALRRSADAAAGLGERCAALA